MKKLLISLVITAMSMISNAVFAYEVEFASDSWNTSGVSAGGYSSNIPAGWTFESNWNTFKLLSNRSGVDGTNALAFDCGSTPQGKIAELRMGADLRIPSEEIVCDNILADLMIYVRPVERLAIDEIQVIATTNDWVETIPVGAAIPIRNDGYIKGWNEFTVMTSIPGISQFKDETTSLKIGVRVTAGGRSNTYVYLHGIKISFKACATPTEYSLVSAQTNDLETVFVPGERGLIKAFVDVSPANKIGSLAVYGVLSRCNGNRTIITTNELENVLGEDAIGGLYYEKLSDAEQREPFDAEESVTCSVVVKYTTNDPTIQPYGKIGTDGFAYECSDLKEYRVGKFGSVWINEIGCTNGECFVELCGTTNRTYLSGWQVVLSSVDKTYTNNLDEVFDFKTNMVNGVVGVETHPWADLDNVVLENATLELRNSAGIVEFSKTGISFPAHYQMTGKAKWYGVTDDDWSYDWTGTSTNTIFMFEEAMEECTPNKVNVGQGFRVPVKTMLYLTTVIDGTTDTLPYAAIDIAVDGIVNGDDGVTHFLGQTSEETGTAAIEICGYSDDASRVVMTSSVGAFAWKCEDLVTTNSMYSGELFLTNVVSAAVAYDDFSMLRGYWDNWSNVKNMQAVLQYWGIGIDGKRKDVLQLDTRSGYKGYATLTTKSYMSTRGKKYLDVSFDFTNESNLETNHCTTVKVLIADSPDFEEGTTCSTIALDNKSTRHDPGVVYSFRELIELPEKFAQDDHVWLRLHATKNYQSTSSYTTMDNLRVAAQDSVDVNALRIPSLPEPTGENFPAEFSNDVELNLTPLTGGIVTNYARNVVGYEVTTNDVAAGTFTTTDAYDAFLATLNEGTVVSTVTNIEQNVVGVQTNLVREVAAELVMTVNDEEIIVPFQFGDGSMTNDIYATESNVVLTIAPSNITTSVNGGLGFLPGDTVKSYARVTYNPDDADEDENGNNKRDVRYYPTPTNVVATETGWYAKGDYLPVYTDKFNVGGPALSCVGKPEITTEGVKFKLHGFAESGITNLTVNLNGTDYTPFEGLDTNAQVRVTGEFELPTGLAPNTEYTVTITATDVNGNALTPATFTFTTLPVATSAVIEGMTPNAVQLTVSGSAAGYVVPSGWTQTSANTWTRGGLSPNSEVTATGIYGTNTNNGVEQRSAAIDATPGHTLAAVATKPPAIEKGVTTVTVGAAAGYGAATDGNPDGTEYAVRVTTSSGRDALVASETGDAIWKTLAAWRETPVEVVPPAIDLAATNYFSFVTRNFDGDETMTDAPVTTNCWFEMTTGFADEKADQAASPFGSVEFSLDFRDPAQSADAQAEVEYRIGSGEWTPLCSFHVPFDEILSSTNLEWDAWAAVGQAQGTYEYTLRARVSSGSRSSKWSEVSGTLDFAPPTVTIGGTPVDGALTSSAAYDFTFSSDDPGDVMYSWAIAGSSGTTVNPGISGSGLADDAYTLTVTATDAMGNTGPAAVRRWTVDATAPNSPTVSGLPGALTKEKSFTLTASGSTDPNGVTYRWTFNGQTATGDSFNVATMTDGDYTVSVVAVDNAGNASAATTVSWTLDATAPTPAPAVAGLPGALTNQKSFTLTASGSADPHNVTYRWTFNGQTATGNSFNVATTADGNYAVSVIAVDDAGNASAATTVNWTLDATAPTPAPTVAGLPGALTNEKNFTLTASGSTDAHGVTYRWTFNGSTVDGDSFNVATTADGNYAVSVIAVDDAGNESAATTVSWKLDATAPAHKPTVAGLPGALTNQKSFTLTASGSTDPNGVTYRWTFNGATSEGATFDVVTTTDGDYSVNVVAVDNAGNESAATTVNWKLDATAPAPAPTVAGLPGVLTKEKTFTLTASGSTDPHNVTYRWTFNGQTATGNSFNVATTADGNYTVSVIAVDDAGNESAATTVSWKLDATAPAPKPTVAGLPGALTNQKTFTLTASGSTDPNGVTYRWTFNGQTVAGDSFNVATTADGNYTVSVIAVDGAGNESAATTVSWTLDATAPTPAPTVAGLPGALTNEKNFTLTASGSSDAHGVTYRWTFNGVTTEGNTFAVSTESDGDYSVSVVAVDNADNVSAATTVSWKLDATAPAPKPTVAGLPGEQTNQKTFTLTASGSTDPNGVTYRWTFNGTPTEGDTLAVSTETDGEYSVSVVAVDNADNVGAATTVNWMLDTVAPTVELASETSDRFNGSVAELLVTATFDEAVTNFTAESVAVSNGTVKAVSDVEIVEDQHVYTIAIVPDSNGEVVVNVEAGVVADAAGNGNGASNELKFIYDDVSPTVRLTSDTPARFNEASAPLVVNVAFSEVVTNFTAGSVTVVNGTDVSVSAVDGSETDYVVSVRPVAEGAVSVQIATGAVADLAGNGNEASAVLERTYDITGPTVTLSSDTRNPFNLDDVFTVKVSFDEAVTNFTADCVTVSNGTVTDVSEVEVVDGTNTYTIMISPITGNNVTVSVEVQANAVTDLAGNGNAASEPLTRTCDTERPTVTFAAMRTDSLTAIGDKFNKGYLEKGSFTVTLTFSEPVTSLLEYAIEVSNGTATALAQIPGSDRAWTVQITPTIADDAEGVIVVQLKSDKFFDAAGNGNAPGEKTWIYDNQKPHDIRISGTPENGATVRGKECRVELTASATDVSGIAGWNWRIYRDNESTPIVNGPYKEGPLNISKVFTESGTYKVSVRPRDASGLNNPTSSDYTDPNLYTWTFIKEDAASADVEFGGGICVKVDPDTGATNSVNFVSVDFRPGEASTFVLNGFDVSSVQDGAPLGMWFVVSDTIGGPRRHVAVSATLDNTTKALTVTLPAAATENKKSLFIIGIDNKEL